MDGKLLRLSPSEARNARALPAVTVLRSSYRLWQSDKSTEAMQSVLTSQFRYIVKPEMAVSIHSEWEDCRFKMGRSGTHGGHTGERDFRDQGCLQ